MPDFKFPKYFIYLMTVAVILLIFSAGCGLLNGEPDSLIGSFADKPTRIGLITGQDGIGNYYYSKVWEGLEKAERELGVGIAYLKAKDEKDYAAKLSEMKKQKAGLILVFGPTGVPAVLEAAKANPKIKYVIVDAEVEDSIPANLLVISYKNEEASFLAGYLAGRMTKSYVVGFICGRDDEIAQRYYYGYKAGLRTANANCELMKGIAATYTNTNRVELLAEQMLKSKADVIFHIAGAAGKGMIKAVEKAGKYAIGQDVDQSRLAPDNVITSVLKNNDLIVYDTVKRFKEGSLATGKKEMLGIAENAVGLSKTSRELIPEGIYASLLKYEEDIIKGKITVPFNEQSYYKYVEN